MSSQIAANFAGATRYLSNLELVVQPGSQSTDLVLILHGWLAWPALMKDVKAIVCGRQDTGEVAALPHADVLVPHYPAWFGANALAEEVAWDIVTLIDAAVRYRERRGEGYERIILIGHSCGAMLVRKAIVYAWGRTEDLALGYAPGEKTWAQKIRRAVLLGAVNRGWDLSRRPRDAPWVLWLLFRSALRFLRIVGLGGFIRGFQRGAPFVANLRIQWIRLAYEAPGSMPVTVQLLGDIDWVVQESDNVDLESSRGFVFRMLRGSGHANCIRLSPKKYPQHAMWREALIEVLTLPDGEIPEDRIRNELAQRPEVARVVFVMHGIRDYGEWTRKVADEVLAIARSTNQVVETETSSYGRFPMGAFLLLRERQRNVRWFMDRYTEALARYPNAKFSFVGHSNGTYLVGSALRRYAACKFDRLVLAGSVLPRDFEWKTYVESGRVCAIQNYVATADWVVAWFPAFFEFMANLVGGKADLGSAGHNGFLDDVARRYMVWCVQGDHGAAISAQTGGNAAMSNLARFALGQEVFAQDVPNYAPDPSARSSSVEFWHRYCILIWLVLAIAIACAVLLPPLWLSDTMAFGWVAGMLGLLLLTLWRI